MSLSWVANNEYKSRSDVICDSHVALLSATWLSVVYFWIFFYMCFFTNFFFLLRQVPKKTPINLSLVIFHDGISLVH
jgi:hypothetical protein